MRGASLQATVSSSGSYGDSSVNTAPSPSIDATRRSPSPLPWASVSPNDWVSGLETRSFPSRRRDDYMGVLRVTRDDDVATFVVDQEIHADVLLLEIRRGDSAQRVCL